MPALLRPPRASVPRPALLPSPAASEPRSRDVVAPLLPCPASDLAPRVPRARLPASPPPSSSRRPNRSRPGNGFVEAVLSPPPGEEAPPEFATWSLSCELAGRPPLVLSRDNLVVVESSARAPADSSTAVRLCGLLGWCELFAADRLRFRDGALFAVGASAILRSFWLLVAFGCPGDFVMSGRGGGVGVAFISGGGVGVATPSGGGVGVGSCCATVVSFTGSTFFFSFGGGVTSRFRSLRRCRMRGVAAMRRWRFGLTTRVLRFG